MQSTDDSGLLREYAENSSDDAFAVLVGRHINLVYSVAVRRVGNFQHAEEITQAVFIILAKKAAALRHEKALSSWLFQAARLTANNFSRSEARRRNREQEACMQSIVEQSGSNTWEKIAPLLDDAVAALNDKERKAIILRFYEGRSLHEIGVALSSSEDAAKKRVARALEKLQRFFLKRGVSSTTELIAGAISANSIQTAPAALAKSAITLAIAKGAAASTSTLTLIKGALKLMAWTKAKTVVVAGVCTLVTAGVIIIAVAGTSRDHPDTPSDSAALQGQWTGEEVGAPGSSSLVITGSTLEFHAANSGEWYKATFSIHQETTPKQMVLVITGCPAPQYVGKTAHAIYQIHDGTLTITGNEPGDPGVPVSFDAPNARELVFKKSS